MEYLTNITDIAKTIDESKIKFKNVFEYPEILYGAPFASMGAGFGKYNHKTQEEINNLSDFVKRVYDNSKKCSTGCFLRFKTNSNKIFIKCELKRKWPYKNMLLWNSSGFDVYEIENGKFIHSTVFAPNAGKSIFCEQFWHKRENEVQIYLPNYNEIIHLYIGAESEILPVDSVKKPAIAFYGNSITQGCAASRSGNSFVNIVSRILNNEVYNFSVTNCCRGFKSVSEIIGMLNLRAVVIDYSRNAESLDELEATHLSFYKEIRKYHPDIPIIILSMEAFARKDWIGIFTKVVKDTYEYAVRNGDNTYYLDQMALFRPEEYSLAVVDDCHYTDFGMFRIAEAITQLLEKAEQKINS